MKKMLAELGASPSFFLQPARIIRVYHLNNLRPDLVAGLTVAVVLIPQAIAYAFIAELPPQVGLYTAIVAAIVGALWGSSHHLQTGPTNAISLLVFSSLVVIASPGTLEFLTLAGLLAVLAGVIQLALGLARLGVLVNDEVFFAATGITDGSLLSGVRYWGSRAQTESLVLRCETGSRRTISSEHLIK